MRVKPRPACGVLAAVLVASGCGGRPAEPRPIAALASSTEAATAFDAIRRAWGDSDPSRHATLRALLERFLLQFPNDGLAPIARVALALTAMQAGDFTRADAELAQTRDRAPGSAHDLWTVARAQSLRLRGDPEAALALLRPLVGKTVDPLGRALFAEELTLTALATHREYEAISYMDAWLRATPEEDKPATAGRVTAMVEQLPKSVVVGAWQAMHAQRASFGYGVDIERILSNRLVRIATLSGDAALARILLDADAGVALSENAGAALGVLAISRRGMNLVSGKTIGLLLPTDSPALRDESADVLRGVMWALGLPRGVRRRTESATNAMIDGGARGDRLASVCAPPEAGPELEEPHASEGVRLVTRNDAGNIDETETSLDELAGEGAAVVIAGLDAETATRALRWGEGHGIAVIALVAPKDASAAAPGFGFTLGEPQRNVISVLAGAAPALAKGPAVAVIDSSDVASYPPAGGTMFGLTLGPPASCDMPAATAGDPRFPIAEWQHAHARAWLVTGSPTCAKDVVAELAAAHTVPNDGIVALTLEAATLFADPAVRVITARAGVIPLVAASDPRADEVRRFTQTLGSVGWWTALGRDGATLARSSVNALPLDDVSDIQSIIARRTRARDMLATARSPLWTTEKVGWEGGRVMKRTVCALSATSATRATQ